MRGSRWNIFCVGARQRDHDQPGQRHERDPHVARAVHLDQDRGGDHSATAASNWLAMPNSGHRVLMPPSGSQHALVQEVAPGRARSRALVTITLGHPARAAERLPDVPQQVLEHEAADARAGVDHGQDEERLEHDGEVVPEAEQPLAADRAAKMCAMPSASDGAPPVRSNSVLLAHARAPGRSICRRRRPGSPRTRWSRRPPRASRPRSRRGC